jgi:ribonuclease BN (tRNA processing enzyme)
MIVYFLGTGAALPAPGETNCSYLVRAGNSALLVDCGPAVLQQLDAADLSPGDVTHLFLTHRHGDHILGFPMFALWWAADGTRLGLPLSTIITSSATWPSLQVLWDHTYGELPVPPFPRVVLPADQPSEHTLSGGVTLRTRPLPHSRFAPVLGLRVEFAGHAVAFTGDTSASPEVIELARGADLLVHDSAYSSTIDPKYPENASSHCTASVAAKNARQAGVQRLALVHIAAPYAGRQAALIEDARLYFDGEVMAPRAGDRRTIPPGDTP